MKPLLSLVLSSVVFIGAGAAFAASTEVNLTPTAVISPWTYWPTAPTQGRFYRPTGIQVGNTYYMYVEGGAFTNTLTGPGSESCPQIGEKILAFSTPWTSQGLRQPFTYVAPVSPCISQPKAHFITGSAFRSSTDGQVKLLIDETYGGSQVQSGDFKETLLGTSSDGVHFTWSTFLKQSVVGSGTYSTYLVKLVQATGNTNWWGTFWWAVCHVCDGTTHLELGDQVTAPGRIRVIMDSTNPRGYVVYILSGGTWKAVNDDGTFNFAPDTTSDILTQSIVFNNGQWEEWGDTALCTAMDGCSDGTSTDCSTFQYEVTNQGGGLGGVQMVTSMKRPMPTKNGLGRLGPFRMQDMNGVRLLYSSSTDRLCATGVNVGFPGSEIIVTEVNN
ncbi:MAG TPA: hypothetical protein VIA62_02985 [Thermoanaerobaculia bacterium]|jgi:hypothetical protein|nr:hypothetical protein [Thermoanaerobaculia bacterium]